MFGRSRGETFFFFFTTMLYVSTCCRKKKKNHRQVWLIATNILLFKESVSLDVEMGVMIADQILN